MIYKNIFQTVYTVPVYIYIYYRIYLNKGDELLRQPYALHVGERVTRDCQIVFGGGVQENIEGALERDLRGSWLVVGWLVATASLAKRKPDCVFGGDIQQHIEKTVEWLV